MTFRELVGEAIGEASMCWVPPPSTAVFDSTRAQALIDRIVDATEGPKPHESLQRPEHIESFESQLRSLLNTWSKEGSSNTPDFVLARYMAACLENFDSAVNARDHWYGFKPFNANAAVNSPLKAIADDIKAGTFRGVVK